MSDMMAFSHRFKLFSIKIEDIQNVSIFMIACSSFVSYLYYNIGSSLWNEDKAAFIKPFDVLLQFVVLHAFIDYFFANSYDVKLHHLFILFIIFNNYYYNITTENRFILSYPLLKTEISSIFYVLKYWLPKKTILYDVNTFLFYISFLKLRIYDFYYEIIYNNISFDRIIQIYSPNSNNLIYTLILPCYGLFVLNIYWFFIINKILYKSFTNLVNINTDILCHKLCYYLYWINIPLSCYIYSYNPNEKYIFDMIGILAVTLSSYRYHHDIYNRLFNKEIEDYSIPNKDNIVLFLTDNIAIHVRSFLVVLTNFYNSEYFVFILSVSAIYHVVTIYEGIINMFELVINHDKHKDIFTKRNNTFLAIPVICDVLFLYMNSPVEIAIPFLLVNVFIGVLFFVEPFYKLTHVGFHLLLIAQTYYMTLSNSVQ